MLGYVALRGLSGDFLMEHLGLSGNQGPFLRDLEKIIATV